eukprot:scaffold98176_cov34-Tisochrysis_lutea.AAC.1
MPWRRRWPGLAAGKRREVADCERSERSDHGSDDAVGRLMRGATHSLRLHHDEYGHNGPDASTLGEPLHGIDQLKASGQHGRESSLDRVD